MNAQAVGLLQQVYLLVRDDDSAATHQTLSQYRSMLLKNITEHIKTAVGPSLEQPAAMQARAADEGEQIEVGVFNQEGEIQHLKSLSVDESRALIKEIEESITEVITRSASDALEIISGPSQ